MSVDWNQLRKNQLFILIGSYQLFEHASDPSRDRSKVRICPIYLFCYNVLIVLRGAVKRFYQPFIFIRTVKRNTVVLNKKVSVVNKVILRADLSSLKPRRESFSLHQNILEKFEVLEFKNRFS